MRSRAFSFRSTSPFLRATTHALSRAFGSTYNSKFPTPIFHLYSMSTEIHVRKPPSEHDTLDTSAASNPTGTYFWFHERQMQGLRCTKILFPPARTRQRPSPHCGGSHYPEIWRSRHPETRRYVASPKPARSTIACGVYTTLEEQHLHEVQSIVYGKRPAKGLAMSG